jgi:chaperonin cofactor prefoldin
MAFGKFMARLQKIRGDEIRQRVALHELRLDGIDREQKSVREDLEQVKDDISELQRERGAGDD